MTRRIRIPTNGRIPEELAERKAAFLEALEKSGGSIPDACKACKVSRQWFYRNRAEDEAFRNAAEEVREHVVDLAESALVKAVKREESWAVRKVLDSMRGVGRGWGEKQHIEHSGTIALTYEERLRAAIEKAHELRTGKQG